MDKQNVQKALKLVCDERGNVKEGSPEWKKLDKAALWLERLLEGQNKA